jgi:hypothetical protein
MYDRENGLLAVSTYAPDLYLTGAWTTFTLDHMEEPTQAYLVRDGSAYDG